MIGNLRSLGLTIKEIRHLAAVYLDRPGEPIGPRLAELLDRAERRIVLEAASFLTGSEEAREVLRSQIEWRHRHGDHDLQVDRLERRDGRVAVLFSWAGESRRRHEWAQLLGCATG